MKWDHKRGLLERLRGNTFGYLVELVGLEREVVDANPAWGGDRVEDRHLAPQRGESFFSKANERTRGKLDNDDGEVAGSAKEGGLD